MIFIIITSPKISKAKVSINELFIYIYSYFHLERISECRVTGVGPVFYSFPSINDTFIDCNHTPYLY